MTSQWKFTPGPAAAAKVREGAADGVREAAEHILETSQRDVPVLTGDLKRSGTVQADGLRATISYRDPISVIVHENTQAHHDQGRAKFLEGAMNSEVSEVREIIGAAIRRKLGG